MARLQQFYKETVVGDLAVDAAGGGEAETDETSGDAGDAGDAISHDETSRPTRREAARR